MEPEIQSLKVTTGWTVSWNTFYDVEPVLEYMDYFCGDSLFLAKNGNMGHFVCVEWRPEEDVNGEFILQVMPFDQSKEETDTARFEWDTVLFKSNTRDKSLVVEMLNALMTGGIEKLKAVSN
jgi:hypothetical protein